MIKYTALVVALATVFALGLGAAGIRPALGQGADHRITICHDVQGNGNTGNGYDIITVDKDSIVNKDGQIVPNGHGTHEGDAIPPFAAGNSGSHEWGAFPGQGNPEIVDNNCAPPDTTSTETTTTTTTTPPPPPPPTTTETTTTTDTTTTTTTTTPPPTTTTPPTDTTSTDTETITQTTTPPPPTPRSVPPTPVPPKSNPPKSQPPKKQPPKKSSPPKPPPLCPVGVPANSPTKPCAVQGSG